jgi:hypothetical protein
VRAVRASVENVSSASRMDVDRESGRVELISHLSIERGLEVAKWLLLSCPSRQAADPRSLGLTWPNSLSASRYSAFSIRQDDSVEVWQPYGPPVLVDLPQNFSHFRKEAPP